jgi:hypothetical protein
MKVTSWSLALVLGLIPIAHAESNSPVDFRGMDYANLEQRGWQPLLLPGMHAVGFAHYGLPADPSLYGPYTLMLKAHDLANMYDTGPAITSTSPDFFNLLARERFGVIPWYGWSYFQVGNSPSPLTNEVLGKLRPLEESGVFSAMEFGEWDYYFHELSSNKTWFQQVMGSDYERLHYLMRPAGWKGYRSMPANRKAAYDEMKSYFTERKKALGGAIASMTGHSQYEAYAAEWGARVIGIEVGENVGYQQSKLAFLRGAARQWNKPFYVQVSPWLGNSCTSSGTLSIRADGFASGLDAGHSLNFAERTWLSGWFAGAAMVNPENSSAIYFDGKWQNGRLNAYGSAARKDYQFMRDHDRGIAYTPVAIVLDHLCGYNAYEGKDWGIFTPTSLTLQTKTLFQEQLFPDSGIDDPGNPEAREDVRPTPYGEMFDVILTSASSDLMASYPILLLTGDITFDQATIASLSGAATRGSRILINADLAKREPAAMAQLRKAGTVEVLETGDPARVITNEKLKALSEELLPIRVAGDPVDHQINRNHSGWVVKIENNAGLAKFGNKPVQIDPMALAHVRLSCREPSSSIREWRTGLEYSANLDSIELTIPPGEIRFVEFQMQ